MIFENENNSFKVAILNNQHVSSNWLSLYLSSPNLWISFRMLIGKLLIVIFMITSTVHCVVFNCRFYDNNWSLLGNAYTCTPTLLESNYESTLSQPALPGTICQEELMQTLPAWTFGTLKSIDCQRILKLFYQTLSEFTSIIQTWSQSQLTT